MKIGVFAACLGSLVALSGCASIMNGSKESVTVHTTDGTAALASARCALSNKKGTWDVTTPGSVTVHRGSEALKVDCTEDGYLPATKMVKSSTSDYVYGNILLGGGIGATVDTVDGSAWKYPQVITVPMQPAPSAPTASAPTGAPTS